MRLLFVADGRSITTHSWLSYWIESGDEVHLISTYPCSPLPGLASFHVLPVAQSRFSSQAGTHERSRLVSQLRAHLRHLRYLLGPLSLARYRKEYLSLVEEITPDLVHALRIPFEGMLAYRLPREVPFIVSIWGNDLTLHAPGSFLMAAYTRNVLKRADALMADTIRDIRLGKNWGFRESRPTHTVPGAGGIRLDLIHKTEDMDALKVLAKDIPVIVNPRGQRPGSLRQDTFFRSIPLVLEKDTKVVFICPMLKGDAQAENLVKKLRIEDRVWLWGKLDQGQLWSLYKRAKIMVSPSIHDGLPNSLIEAMVCGCFPIAGNIESMGEWITDGVNGLLVDASNEVSLAEAMLKALHQPALCARAADINMRLIQERANFQKNMIRVRAFYQSILVKR
jgi:glycosyltransferase involved in cell wall biosynthesis